MNLDWVGLDQLKQAMQKAVQDTDAVARMNLTQAAALVEAGAKKNFSGSHKRGRPHVGGDQPNVVTGTLRRSIMTTPAVRTGYAAYTATVGPSVVYARRVELGFTGTDSAGRTYRQRPYPYFGPAVKAAQPRIQTLAARNWAKIIGG